MSFDNKIAVVTGASRGIGRAIALELARRGALVVAAARGVNAQAVVDEIRAYVEEQLADRFQALSTRALDANNLRFLELADGRM